MDILYFLKLRTDFIRSHYDTCVLAFETIKSQIEEGKPPFDGPVHDESGEPPFLEEWMEAESSIQIVGRTCVSLLADALKLYLNELQRRQLRFSFAEEEGRRLKKDFVAAYRDALGEIFGTDWSEAKVDFAVIEQVVLARNRGQHGTHLTSFYEQHDPRTLTKHPKPIFASSKEWGDWEAAGNPESSFFNPRLEIARDALFSAISEIERLAEWIEANMDRAVEWQNQQRSNQSSAD